MANNALIDEDIAQLRQEADCPDEFIREFLVAMDTENVKNSSTSCAHSAAAS